MELRKHTRTRADANGQLFKRYTDQMRNSQLRLSASVLNSGNSLFLSGTTFDHNFLDLLSAGAIVVDGTSGADLGFAEGRG